MRLIRDTTAAVIVDIQQRLFPHIDGHAHLLARVETLVRGLALLEVPVVSTEQYPKGLGHTVPELATVLDEAGAIGPPIVKTAFSCCDEADFGARIGALGKKTIVLAGIETHVCILQTVLDLLAGGYEPVVVADAVSSRRPYDREIALRRIEREGARLTTVESILFELQRETGTERFKQISKLVK